MRVKIKVLGKGGNAGKEIPIKVSPFIIGRGDGCQLRPQSDTISRKHCAILLKGAKLFVKDLGGKNGTYVNGERVESEQALEMGDRLRVGPLQFEILIDHSVGGTKRPAVTSVQEAVERTAGKNGGGKADNSVDDWDVSDWLTEEDQAEREKRISDPETRQYDLSEIEQQKLKSSGEKDDESSKDKKKKEPGKLPTKPQQQCSDSGSAAEQMLKKFFNTPGAGTP